MTDKQVLLQGIAILIVLFIVWGFVMLGILYINTWQQPHEREVIINGK